MTEQSWLDAPDQVAERWLQRQGKVRNVVRQTLAARFLDDHLPDRRPLEVLDAGCGQGTQSLWLAEQGHTVVGLDPDERMLEAFRRSLDEADPRVDARVRLVLGTAEDASTLLAPASYDVVLCHGVLMYVPDPAPVVSALAAMLVPGGVLSVLARNQPNVAIRAGHRGRWDEALAALRGDTSYTNELGAAARADTVAGLVHVLEQAGLQVQGWYGVRVLSDTASLDAEPPLPGSAELATLLDAEELAGRTDPYRRVAPLVQVVAKAPGPST